MHNYKRFPILVLDQVYPEFLVSAHNFHSGASPKIMITSEYFIWSHKANIRALLHCFAITVYGLSEQKHIVERN